MVVSRHSGGPSTDTAMWKSLLLSRALSLLTALLALPAALLAVFREWLRRRRLSNRFPCPRALPLIGNLFDVGVGIPDIEFFKYACLDLIPGIRTGKAWLGPYRIIFLCEPEDIQIFLQNSKSILKPKLLFKCAIPLVGNGLICESGERWKRHHKIIAPTFHPDILGTFISIFNAKTDVCIEVLNEKLEGADGQAFEISPFVKKLTYDMVVETTLGVPSNQQTNEDKVLFDALDIVHRIVGYRGLRPWLYIDFLYNMTARSKIAKRADGIIREEKLKIIREREKLLKEERETEIDDAIGEKQRLRLLDAMLWHQANGAQISEQDMLDEVQTTIVAGYDTVNLAVQMCLYCLAKYPHIQEKAVQELEDIFHDGNTEVNNENLSRLVYLEMVLKETLRLHPPIWIFMRTASGDVPLSTCDLVIPVGETVLISPKTVHMDPKYYPEPEKFDPERFSLENSEMRHPFAFIPFSAGQRACIGKRYAMIEGLTVLAKILYNFEIRLDPTYEPVFTWGLSAELKDPMRLKLFKRIHKY